MANANNPTNPFTYTANPKRQTNAGVLSPANSGYPGINGREQQNANNANYWDAEVMADRPNSMSGGPNSMVGGPNSMAGGRGRRTAAKKRPSAKKSSRSRSRSPRRSGSGSGKRKAAASSSSKACWTMTTRRATCKDGKVRTLYRNSATGDLRVRRKVQGSDGTVRYRYLKA